ncbi:hypothetical protein NHQ30_010582 [Ciborinia camelliae]|nr:hypothetical protein NHQ30_010582 [Ciborinia camelliae]
MDGTTEAAQRLNPLTSLRHFSHRKSNENSGMEELGVHGAVEKENQEQKLSVAKALEQLQEEIKKFQEEVNMCGQEMLGRVERNVGAGVEDTKIFIDNQNKRAFS